MHSETAARTPQEDFIQTVAEYSEAVDILAKKYDSDPNLDSTRPFLQKAYTINKKALQQYFLLREEDKSSASVVEAHTLWTQGYKKYANVTQQLTAAQARQSDTATPDSSTSTAAASPTASGGATGAPAATSTSSMPTTVISDNLSQIAEILSKTHRELAEQKKTLLEGIEKAWADLANESNFDSESSSLSEEFSNAIHGLRERYDKILQTALSQCTPLYSTANVKLRELKQSDPDEAKKCALQINASSEDARKLYAQWQQELATSTKALIQNSATAKDLTKAKKRAADAAKAQAATATGSSTPSPTVSGTGAGATVTSTFSESAQKILTTLSDEYQKLSDALTKLTKYKNDLKKYITEQWAILAAKPKPEDENKILGQQFTDDITRIENSYTKELNEIKKRYAAILRDTNTTIRSLPDNESSKIRDELTSLSRIYDLYVTKNKMDSKENLALIEENYNATRNPAEAKKRADAATATGSSTPSPTAPATTPASASASSTVSVSSYEKLKEFLTAEEKKTGATYATTFDDTKKTLAVHAVSDKAKPIATATYATDAITIQAHAGPNAAAHAEAFQHIFEAVIQATGTLSFKSVGDGTSTDARAALEATANILKASGSTATAQLNLEDVPPLHMKKFLETLIAKGVDAGRLETALAGSPKALDTLKTLSASSVTVAAPAAATTSSSGSRTFMSRATAAAGAAAELVGDTLEVVSGF